METISQRLKSEEMNLSQAQLAKSWHETAVYRQLRPGNQATTLFVRTGNCAPLRP